MKTLTIFLALLVGYKTLGQSFQLKPTDVQENKLSVRSIEMFSGDYFFSGAFRDSVSGGDRGFISRVSSTSQNVVWSQVFEVNSIITVLAKTLNGDFVGAGRLNSSSGIVVRIDASGNILWRVNILGQIDIRSVAESFDGNIWIAGSAQKELIGCLTSTGGILWFKIPPVGISSVINKLVPDGSTMLAFGTETSTSQSYNQQISIRRFSSSGDELGHKIVGSFSASLENFCDVTPVSDGGYVILSQYVYPVAPFTGRQEIGLIKVDQSLSLVASMTRAYILPSRNLVSPKIATDNQYFFVFCTTTPNAGGGTLVFKTLISNGNVESSKFVSRGFTRIDKILLSGNSLFLTSSQDLVQSVGAPPETQADVSVFETTSLVPLASCEPLLNQATVSLAPYYGQVTMISRPTLVWLNHVLVFSQGLTGQTLDLEYDDCGTGLPVELLNFRVKNEGARVSIRWSTATETNSDYFEIQRSSGGVDWVIVCNVDAVGTSTSTTDYSAIDNSTIIGTVYYRLRQVDTDGREYFSRTEIVTVDKFQEVKYFNTLGQEVFRENLVPGGLYVEQSQGFSRLKIYTN